MKGIITTYTLISFVAGYLFGAIPHVRFDSPICLLFLAALVVFWSLPAIKSRAGAKGLLLLGSFVWAYVIIDIPLRLFFIEKIYPRKDEYLIQPWPEYPQITRLTPNAVSDMTTCGDLAVMSGIKSDREPRHVRYEIDALGYRNAPAVPGQIYDYVVLGDSFAAGAGTTQERSLSFLLNNKHGMSTYNLSVPGTSPWNSLMTAKLRMKNIPVRKGTTILWILFGGNDLDDLESSINRSLDENQLRRKKGFSLLKASVQNFQGKSPLRRFLTLLFIPRASPDQFTVKKFINGREMIFFNTYVRSSQRTLPMLFEHPMMSRMGMIIKEMKSFTDKNGFQVVILTVLPKSSVYSWLLYDEKPWSTKAESSAFYLALKKSADECGVPIFDLTPALVTASREVYEKSGGVLWWYDDTHLNDEGHAAMASVISGLRAKGKL